MNEWYKSIYMETRGIEGRMTGTHALLDWKDMRGSIEETLTEHLGLGDIFEEGAYDENEVTLFLITIMMLLHTHRHKKNDAFIVEAREKFEEICDFEKPLFGVGPFLSGSIEEYS